MTLLEVLAALVILATMLVGILLARARALHQQDLAERRLAAVAAADQLLEQWRVQAELPKDRSGEVLGHPEWVWQLQVTEPAADSALPYALARLVVMAQSDQQTLAQVQWLVPRPEKTPPRAQLQGKGVR